MPKWTNGDFNAYIRSFVYGSDGLDDRRKFLFLPLSIKTVVNLPIGRHLPSLIHIFRARSNDCF